jgi:hypothetical protein
MPLLAYGKKNTDRNTLWQNPMSVVARLLRNRENLKYLLPLLEYVQEIWEKR